MRPIRDLTGQRFGRLLVTKRADMSVGGLRWHCICDCGNTRVIRSCSLVTGTTQSCGCLRKSAAAERMRVRSLKRAAEKRYRPVDEVIAEVFRDPLGRLAEYARQALLAEEA